MAAELLAFASCILTVEQKKLSNIKRITMFLRDVFPCLFYHPILVDGSIRHKMQMPTEDTDTMTIMKLFVHIRADSWVMCDGTNSFCE